MDKNVPGRGHLLGISFVIFYPRIPNKIQKNTQQYWQNEYNLLLSIILNTQRVTSHSLDGQTMANVNAAPHTHTSMLE